MPALTAGAQVYKPSDTKLVRILASRLARHTVSLKFALDYLVYPALLRALSNGFPNLRELFFTTELDDQWVEALSTVRFPLSLQKVRIRFSQVRIYRERTFQGSRFDAICHTINGMIVSMSQLPHLHTLHLVIPTYEQVRAALVFAPLQSARSLTTLYIDAETIGEELIWLRKPSPFLPHC
jgi:hypothetical protein